MMIYSLFKSNCDLKIFLLITIISSFHIILVTSESDNCGSDINNEKIQIRYDGAQLWRIKLNDVKQPEHDQYQIVDEFQQKFDGQTWNARNNEIDILLKSNCIEDATNYFKTTNLTYEILINDLQQIIETENPSKDEIEMLQNRKGHKMTWKAYHRMADIHGYLDYLSQTYTELCSIQIIGYSVENRPLKLIKISNNDPKNNAIWIDGGMHAREWISPATVTYIINKLIDNWDELPNYMKKIDWYILPLANPDGYEYTHQYDRLWRKSRRFNSNSNFQCIGVDLNRNFGYKWGGLGNSKYPCAETYGGDHAFSEPETLAIKNFLTLNSKKKFQSYLSFHSYGQFILYPWGYDKSLPIDYKDLDRVGMEAAKNIRKNSGTVYRVGPSGALLYPAAGGSDDWAKGELNIKYSYTIEMRDTGRYGFILPSYLIETTSNDGYIFVETIAKAIL